MNGTSGMMENSAQVDPDEDHRDGVEEAEQELDNLLQHALHLPMGR
jgi:hypothetical protein